MSKPHCSASRSALAGGREARLLFNEALTVNRGKSLHESEDKSITETRKQRQTKYDRFSRKHDKRPAGRLDHLVQGEPLLKSLNFVRTIDVVLACFTTTLGFSIEEDGSSRFGDDKEVEDLNETAKDELSPANPSPSSRISTQQMVPRKKSIPIEVSGNKGTDNRTDNTSLLWLSISVALRVRVANTYSDRREDNKCYSPLLFIWIVKISNYAIYQQLSHQT